MRLIDANALKQQVESPYTEYPIMIQIRKALKDFIDEAPTIDPVKRGKWIKDGEKCALYKCSACNDLCTVAGWANCIPEEQMYKAFKFCPNCGAQMKRSEDE